MSDAPAYNFAYLDEGTKRMIRRAILKAIAIPGYQVPFASREMPMPYGWGTGGVQVTAAILGPADVLKVIDQGADDTTNAVSIRRSSPGPPASPPPPRTARRRSSRPATASRRRRCTAGQILVSRCRSPSRCASSSRARPRRAAARAGRIRPDARQALRGHRPPRPHRHHLRLPGEGRGPLRDGPVADPEVRQPEDGRLPGAAAVRRRPREAHLRGAALHQRGALDFEDHPFERTGSTALRAVRRRGHYLDEVVLDDRGGRMFVCSDTDHCETRRAAGGARAATRTPQHAPRLDRGRPHDEPTTTPLLIAEGLTKCYGRQLGCRDVVVRLYDGRGAGHRRRIRLRQVDAAAAARRRSSRRSPAACATACATARRATSPTLGEAERRFLMRTDWGFVHQDPRRPAHGASRPAAMSASG